MVGPSNTTRTGRAEPSGSTAAGLPPVVVVGAVVAGAVVVGAVVVGGGVVDIVEGATVVAGTDGSVEAIVCDEDVSPTFRACEPPPLTSATSIAAAPTATAPHARPARRRMRWGAGRAGSAKWDPLCM